MRAATAKNNQPRLSAAPVGYFLALLIGLAATGPVQAADKDLDELQKLMVISKMTGVCGVMTQMAAFQKTTQMAGGSEFFERFWRTEFARLGMSQQTFLQLCERSITSHNGLMQSLEGLEK